MKRTLQLLTLLLALCLCLSACGLNFRGSGGDGEKETDDPKKTELPEETGKREEIDEPDEPDGGGAVIEVPDASAMSLTEYTGHGLRLSYPAQTWTMEDGFSLPILYLNESMYTPGAACNVNVQNQGAGLIISQAFMESLVEQMEALGGYITIQKAELRVMNGREVIYLENVTQLTDDYLDLMLETGTFTEEYIEQAGGREALLSIPPATAVGVYTVKDGNGYIFTGTYYNEDQKQQCLELIGILDQTVAPDA